PASAQRPRAVAPPSRGRGPAPAAPAGKAGSPAGPRSGPRPAQRRPAPRPARRPRPLSGRGRGPAGGCQRRRRHRHLPARPGAAAAVLLAPREGAPGHPGPREARPARRAAGDGATEGRRPRARRPVLTPRVTTPARRGGELRDRIGAVSLPLPTASLPLGALAAGLLQQGLHVG